MGGVTMIRSRSPYRLFWLFSMLSLAVLVAACAEAGSGDDDDDDSVVYDSGPPKGSDAGGGGCDSCDTTTSNGCSNDRCVCNLGPACSGGSTCCPLGCRNLDNDPSNCGQCGRPCGANETCMGGMCVCSSTGTDCGADDCCPSGCTDTDSDNNNCGICGTVCMGGDVCTGGMCGCAFTCPAPNPLFPSKIVCCGDGCYDICNDPGHCDGCDATTCSSCTLGACDDGDPDLLNCFLPI